MKRAIKNSINQSVYLRFFDSTTGQMEVGVTDTTPGLALWYRRDGAAKVAITPVALAAEDTAHTDGGIKHIDRGYCRVDVPDAAFLEGVTNVLVGGSATGMDAQGCLVEIIDAPAVGAGARTCTITVNDGATPLEGALIRVTKGAETYLAETNVSGVATFYLDDGTWTVGITLPLYSFAGTTLVVDGAETRTYSMTAVSIAPSSGNTTTGYLTVLDKNGNAAAGVGVLVTVEQVAPALAGIAYPTDSRVVVSNNVGVAQVPNMFKGVTYSLQRGDGKKVSIKIPTTAGSTYALPSIIG